MDWMPGVMMGLDTHANQQWPNDLEYRSPAEGPWASAVDCTPVGLATLDEEGRILQANACMAHLLGRAVPALVGVPFGSLVLANDREAWLRDRSEVIRHGRTIFDRERRVFRTDGMLLWLSVSVAPFVSRGSAAEDPRAAMVLSASDVSGRKCLQEAFNRGQAELRDLVEARTAELRAAHLRLRLADRMAAVGTLGAGLGHDMNNVLLPVRAHLNALAAMIDRTEGEPHVTAIRQSLAYLQQLADGLHFLALDPEKEDGATETDLMEWWTEVEAILPKAIARGVAFQCDLPPRLPRIAVAPHQLTQAILNLVVNASEAIRPRHAGAALDLESGDGLAADTSDGSGTLAARTSGPRGTVRLWAEPVEAAGPTITADDGHPVPAAIRIGVTDDGPGMAPEVARRAGTLYYTTKSRAMGTGLGLALVRMVADRARGTMDIDSTPGVGTTVSLTLPVAGARPNAGRRVGRRGETTTDQHAPRTLGVLDGAGMEMNDERRQR